MGKGDYMAKLVCHAEKYKKGSVPSIERHNERKNKNYSNEEIDPSRTQLNYDLIPRESDSYYHSVMNLVNARDNPYAAYAFRVCTFDSGKQALCEGGH